MPRVYRADLEDQLADCQRTKDLCAALLRSLEQLSPRDPRLPLAREQYAALEAKLAKLQRLLAGS